MSCEHDIVEKETACADGYCPLCLESLLAKERSKAERLAEAIEPLMGIAESYAMQTYDRGGTTRKRIEDAKEALAEFDGTK